MNIFFEKLLASESNSILIMLFGILICFALISFFFAKSNLTKIFVMSLLSSFVCILYLLLDAPDVAMTEASIGACLSTIILLLFARNIPESTTISNYSIGRHFVAICCCFIVLLIFYHLEQIIPKIGLLENPIHKGVSDYYIRNTESEIGIPAFVAAILASYRGFDTLGETCVILIAGLGACIIFGVQYEKK